MAKIYETKDDFKRDKLDEQAKDLRLRASEQSKGGITLLGSSLIADKYYDRSPHTRGWLGVAANVLGFLGMFEIVRSWFTHNKAHDLELERERMGPAHVKLPASAAPELAETCEPCTRKKLGIEPKTLTEHAQTLDSLLGRQ